MYTLSSVVEKIGNCRLIKDGQFQNFNKLSEVSEPNTLVFISKESYINHLDNSLISTLIIPESFNIPEAIVEEKGIIAVEGDPRDFFFEIMSYLYDKERKTEKSSIHEDAIISKQAYISEINVKIGAGTIIEPGVVINDGTIIGRNCIIRAGTIIGTEGFEVYTGIDGLQKVIKHWGKVLIKDNVELQANNTVSKGLFPDRNTVIHDEVTTDNQVHIAHGVIIGERTRIAACAMIAGRVTIGKGVWIGPSASISSGISIEDHASITIGAVVTKDVSVGQKVTGNFAIDHKKFMRFLMTIR